MGCFFKKTRRNKKLKSFISSFKIEFLDGNGSKGNNIFLDLRSNCYRKNDKERLFYIRSRWISDRMGNHVYMEEYYSTVRLKLYFNLSKNSDINNTIVYLEQKIISYLRDYRKLKNKINNPRNYA